MRDQTTGAGPQKPRKTVTYATASRRGRSDRPPPAAGRLRRRRHKNPLTVRLAACPADPAPLNDPLNLQVDLHGRASSRVRPRA